MRNYREIETLPRERMDALQLERLRAAVARVLGCSRARGAAARRRHWLAAGHPLARRPEPPAVHPEARPPRALPVRTLRRPRGRPGPDPRLEWHAGQADDRRLHPQRPCGMGGGGGAVPRAGRRPARNGGPQRLRLWPVYRRARPPPGRRTVGLHGGADLGRDDPAPGDAVAGSGRAGALLHPIVRAAASPRRSQRRRSTPGPGSGWKWASSAPSPGPSSCAASWSAGSASPRSTSTGSPKSSGQACRPSASRVGTARTSRRITSCPRSWTPRPACRSRRGKRASWC